MSGSFEVCWQRLYRADAHRVAIARAWNALIESEAYVPVVDVQANGTGAIWIEQTTPFPESIALDFGEFLYQLRGALDACVYETACLNTKAQIPARPETLEFPICDSPARFEGAQRKIDQLTSEQRALVERMQPYNAPQDLAPHEVPFSFNRALGILNDWARKDRHRRLHFAVTFGTRVRPRLRVPLGTKVVEFAVKRPLFVLKDRHEVATFRLSGYKAGMNVQANPNLMLDIGIDETPEPCHHTDTLAFRMEVMELAVAAVVGNMSKIVGHRPPREFVVGMHRLSFDR